MNNVNEDTIVAGLGFIGLGATAVSLLVDNEKVQDAMFKTSMLSTLGIFAIILLEFLPTPFPFKNR